MNELKIFQNEAFGAVRVVEYNGEPWFVASDVAKVLGYENPQEATRDHCKKVNKITQPSVMRPTVNCPPVFFNIIPESDVYRLVMRSNLPKAVEFQDWICEDVIPSIRKHGFYGVSPAVPDFSNPAVAARAWADEYEAKMLAQATAKAALEERDHAIRTKAEIGKRREATAMATAYVAVRKMNELENELGKGKTYKQVKAIPWLLDVFAPSRGMYVAVGKVLTSISEQLGVQTERIQSCEYPEGVKAYHTKAISVLYDKLMEDRDMMGKYRNLTS